MMILKFKGQVTFSALTTDDCGGSSNDEGDVSKCYIGGRPLVDTVVDADAEGLVTVAFPGYRFHGEIASLTGSDFAKRAD